MHEATFIHNDSLRALLTQHNGYEVAFHGHAGGEGSFCIAFQHTNDALAWCGAAQKTLLTKQWPEELLAHPGAAEEWGDMDDMIIFKGLRVRMGVHVGKAKPIREPITRRIEYMGPVVNTAAHVTALASGGQVLITEAAYQQTTTQELVEAEPNRVQYLGKRQSTISLLAVMGNCSWGVLTPAFPHTHTHRNKNLRTQDPRT